jgi:hypothetical protein
MSRLEVIGAALFAAAILCCGSDPRHPTIELPPASALGPPLRFSYRAIDGRPISTESLTNRVSVIGFLTTYDVHSQAEARLLVAIERHHTPRVNVAALMLEAPENLPLVEAFSASLGLGYPVAIADAATIAGEGAFAGLHHVPSVVVLDRAGREAWRHVGFVNEAALEAAVRAVEAASPPASEERVGTDRQ